MAFPVIISFYTANTPYEDEVKRLIASCETFGLESSIDRVDSFGTWELNCAYKPFFILKKLDELERDVLWVDADGAFMRQPCWLKAFEADLSVRFDESLPNDHPSKVISSTIFVRNNKGARSLLKRWIKECHKTLLQANRQEEFWDQTALRDAILEGMGSVSPLPLSYAKIFDHPIDCTLVDEPVIEHFQASRRFKRFIF